MFRTKTCGELRITDCGSNVVLSGWVQKVRKMGGMVFVDIRDRYGITQLVFNESTNAELCERANKLGREYVIQVEGVVNERSSKNSKIPTGDIEIIVNSLNLINAAETPPFTIEDDTDGGDDLRMKYRYLDLRRGAVRRNLELRHKMVMEIRKFLDSLNFMEVETPILINSTPDLFRAHIRHLLSIVETKPKAQQVVFLKSWNEWGEGNYMEPDLKYGNQYIEALREEIVK